MDDLTKKAHKIAEIMYKQAQQQQQGDQGNDAGQQQSGPEKGDDVIDADYEDVK